jgi:pilus assembly protein FimV
MTNSRLPNSLLSILIATIFDLGAFASAHALGLGELKVQSALGQPFLANVNVLAADVSELENACFKAKVETPDGQFLAFLKITTSRSIENGRITLSSSLAIAEPAVKVILNASCPTPMQREYFALLDLPPLQTSALNTVISDAPAATSAISDSLQPLAAKPEASEVFNERKRRPRRQSPQPVYTPQLTFDTSKSLDVSRATPRQKDVLRLTASDEPPAHDLLMSYGLSDAASPVDLADLQKEHARLMSLLRDEQPDLAAPMTAVSAPVSQVEQVKRESKTQTVEDESSKIVIGGLGFICLGSLLWGWSLWRRLRRFEQAQPSEWWSTLDLAQEDQAEEEFVQPVKHDDVAHSKKTYQPRAEADFYAPSLDPLNDEKKIHQMHAAQVDQSLTSPPEFMTLTKSSSVNLEEISDVTQEAEFWVSVNDLPRAIEILEPQVELEDSESPLPWLYLLDLYRATKNRDKYDALKQRFVKSFNAKVIDYDEQPSTQDERHIEDFSHLMSRICTLWYTDDILPFLQSLLVDDRGGQREGFELSVYREILFLIGLANELIRMPPHQRVAHSIPTSKDLPDLNLDYLLGAKPSFTPESHKALSHKPAFEHQILLPEKFELGFEEMDDHKKSSY